MAPLATRWKLMLGTLAAVAAWGAVSPGSLLLAVGVLSAFGCFIAIIQHAIESGPERRPRARG